MTLRISVPRVGVLDVFEPDVKNSILINSVLKLGTRISKLDHIFMSQFIYISLFNVHQRALLIERCVLLYEWMSACVKIVISHLVFFILSFKDQVQVYRFTPTSSIKYMIKKTNLVCWKIDYIIRSDTMKVMTVLIHIKGVE